MNVRAAQHMTFFAFVVLALVMIWDSALGVTSKRNSVRRGVRMSSSYLGMIQDSAQTKNKIWSQWVDAVATEDWTRAGASDWDAIQKVVPPKARLGAEFAYLHVLSSLGYEQALVSNLVRFLGNRAFRESAPGVELLEHLGAGRLAAVLEHQGIVFNVAERKMVEALPDEGPLLDLKAWVALRADASHQRGTLASQLPANHPFRGQLTVSEALRLARAGSLDAAVTTIAEYLKLSDIGPRDRESAQITLARLYFQQADLANAEAAYSLVPLTSPRAAEVREELLWVWLRDGNTAKLRGTINGLASHDLGSKFLPDMFVVRAISNLKLCYYDQTSDDVRRFGDYARQHAQPIDEALNAAVAPRPPELDWYTSVLVRAVELRHIEIESASAGPLARELSAKVAEVESALGAEYARLWRNRDSELREAIRKMRFVKIELLSQVGNGMKPNLTSEVSERTAKAARATVDAEASGKWSYPYDGVAWSDELYMARSTAHNACL